jgi:hypothetical protein
MVVERRLYIPLSKEELAKLCGLAERERRPPRDQAALIVAKYLEAHCPEADSHADPN